MRATATTVLKAEASAARQGFGWRRTAPCESGMLLPSATTAPRRCQHTASDPFPAWQQRLRHQHTAPQPAPPSAGDARYIPSHVKLYEMGPRDGLQNQKEVVPTAVKVDFINALSGTGLRYIEASSFVSKQWIPQLGDADTVCATFDRVDGVTYSALVPNMAGMERMLALPEERRLGEVAVFAAATDSFSRRNINCNVMDSFERFKPVLAAAKAHGIRVRGYVSCALGCPYEGPVAPDAVGFVAQSLLELGCYEVSLGDTIGVGTPASVKRMLASVKAHVPVHHIAVHFHDTYGQAVANVLAALEEGVATVDSSVAGLGGCPYAKGASGNVSTEDVVYLLHGLGCTTGVDLDRVIDAGDALCRAAGIPNRSKVAAARLAHRATLAGSEVETAHLQAQIQAAAAGAGAAGAEAGARVQPDTGSLKAALAKAQAKGKDARIALGWPEAPPPAPAGLDLGVGAAGGPAQLLPDPAPHVLAADVLTAPAPAEGQGGTSGAVAGGERGKGQEGQGGSTGSSSTAAALAWG